jgi:outer membrane protein assembly factor BamB
VPSIPAVVDGVVYVGSHARRVHAIDAETGARRWEHATAGTVSGSPAVFSGVLYVGGDDGRLYALRLPALARPPVESPSG